MKQTCDRCHLPLEKPRRSDTGKAVCLACQEKRQKELNDKRKEELRKEIRKIEKKHTPNRPYGKYQRKPWLQPGPRYFPHRDNPDMVIDISL